MKVSFYTPNGAHPGQFVQTLEGPLDLVIAPTAAAIGLPYVEGDYGSGHYVVDGQVLPRPACPAGLDGSALTNVPAGSVIRINGQDYDCPDGGTVDLEFDQPGTYSIRVTGWPHLDGAFDYENPPQ